MSHVQQLNQNNSAVATTSSSNSKNSKDKQALWLTDEQQKQVLDEIFGELDVPTDNVLSITHDKHFANRHNVHIDVAFNHLIFNAFCNEPERGKMIQSRILSYNRCPTISGAHNGILNSALARRLSKDALQDFILKETGLLHLLMDEWRERDNVAIISRLGEVSELAYRGYLCQYRALMSFKDVDNMLIIYEEGDRVKIKANIRDVINSLKKQMRIIHNAYLC